MLCIVTVWNWGQNQPFSVSRHCCSHATGNTRISGCNCTVEGRCPSRIGSTRSGASSVIRSVWDTNDRSSFSASASSLIVEN